MNSPLTTDLVSQMRGDAAMHRHYGRDWSSELMTRGADEIARLRGLLGAAKEEHYCGKDSDCKSPFCIAMREAGEV